MFKSILNKTKDCNHISNVRTPIKYSRNFCTMKQKEVSKELVHARKTFVNEDWDIDPHFICYSFESGMHVQSFQYPSTFRGDMLKLLQSLVTTQTLQVFAYPTPCEPFDKNDVRLPLILTYDQHGDRVGKFEWNHNKIGTATWEGFVNAVWDILAKSAEETVDHYILLQSLSSLFKEIYTNAKLSAKVVEPSRNAPNKKALYIRKLKTTVSLSDVTSICERFGALSSAELVWQAECFGNTHALVFFENEADAGSAKRNLESKTGDHLSLSQRQYATPQELRIEFAESHLAPGVNNLLTFAPEPDHVQMFVEKDFVAGYQGGFRYFMVVPQTHTVYCFTGFNEAR